MSRLGFEPILDSYLAVALFALVLVLLLGVTPQFGSLTRSRRITLVALRALVVLLAVLAMLRPTWITTIHEPRTSVLLLLLDASRSMILPADGGSRTRWEAQSQAFAAARDELARLAGKTEVRVFAYDNRLLPLEFSGGQIKLPQDPAGQQTDIGTTLHEALRGEQGKRVAAVLLSGDGVQTAFEPLIETQEAARKLRDDFAAPLYTVTFGLSGNAAQARDLAIERLDEQFTVFVKNEVVIRGLVRVRGYVKQDLPIELLLVDEKNQPQTIGRRTIQAAEDNQQVEVEFTYTPQTPGHYRLTLRADKQPGELVEKNNKLDAYLTVLEGGLRVLYLDGESRFERKFLRWALDASPDIELDDAVIPRRSQVAESGQPGWPVDLGPDFAAGKYDAYILGDLDAAALGQANLEKLAQEVGQRGKGLLMIGGRSSFGRGHYFDTPLRDALPIVIDRIEGAEFGDAALERFFLPGPIQMVPAGPHAITRLTGDADNAAAWSKLPPLAWANKFAGVKQVPGVRILLQSPQGQPLLVSGEFGAGRTLAFAGESTYLWRMHDFQKEHNRFWRQVILWLVKRDDLNRDEVWIRLDQRRFNPGSKVQIQAGARTASGDPIGDARLETFLVHPGGKREPLVLSQAD
ncbi:MAG TPA: glutamine amidotransferase, partial [Pirellulaceae bacterium]|nr:glutamine amidotransferase [Pirellulaceae bacterium]